MEYKERCYRNSTKSCSIGMSLSEVKKIHPLRIPDHMPDRPWLMPSRYKGGEHFFVPPGAIWMDKDGQYNVIRNGEQNRNIFVHCKDELEFQELQQAHPELNPVRDGAELKGFFGPLAVLEDVTHLKDEVTANAIEYISGREHVETLRREASEREAALAASRKEVDKVKEEYEKMKAELASLKKK